jgi:peroxiredoxin
MQKKTVHFLSTIISCFLLLITTCEKAAGQIDSVQKEILDFRLTSTSGNEVSLSDYPDAVGFVIVFTSNNCPFAKLYPSRLNELNDIYKPKGIPLIAIRSTDVSLMPDDAFDKMIKLVKRERLNFPYLADDKQDVAKNFHAEKTPHAFVIWKVNDKWIIKYSGAIDDNGAEPAKVQHAYVKEALNELIAGKEVSNPITRSVGCTIKYKTANIRPENK